MYKKILLPTDGSEYALNAAKHAIWAAKLCSADLIVLNVVDYSKLPEIIAVDVVRNLKDMLNEEGNAALDKLSGLLDKSPEIDVSFIIKEGPPASIILQTIEDNDIDLIVMGNSGKHGLDMLLMGSVAEKVVRKAKCAVTIIP